MSGNEVTHYPLKWISYSSKSDRELHNNTFCFKLAQEESNMNEMRKEWEILSYIFIIIQILCMRLTKGLLGQISPLVI